MSERHISVLRDETLAALQPLAGATVIDGTFGAGGHSAAMLEQGAMQVIGIDRDPTALAQAADLQARFGSRLTLVKGCYGDLDTLAQGLGVAAVDALLLDIGVSSMQLDTDERGFSFMRNGPLDGRMGDEGVTVADLVNTSEEAVLANIIYTLGEEPKSRRIARFIVAARAEAPIRTTLELAAIVSRAIGRGDGARHPATRTFQALRMAVNDELGELSRGLVAAERMLKADGRLAVITFHSLEDRLVKNFLRARSGYQMGDSRHRPPAEAAGPAATFLRVAKPVRPSAREIAANPRARSATLRAAVRSTSAAWPQEIAA
jgi:16S rRNA (cytosine1402-N4)-methyltransferase